MPDMLHINPVDVDTVEKRAQLRVCVVGCGRLGASYAISFAEAGFKVFCTDSDQIRLKKLTKGGSAVSEQEIRGFVRAGKLSSTDDVKTAVAQSDVIFLTSGVNVDEKGTPSFQEAEGNCKQIGAGLRRGALVVFAGLAGFGFTWGVVKETLEGVSGLKVGTDFGLAYVNRIVGAANHSSEIMVAANDQASLNGTFLILSAVFTNSTIRKISDVRTGEMAALLLASRKNVLTAFIDEFAVLCEKAGLDVFKVSKSLNGDLQETDNFPSISNYGKKETELLLEYAEGLEVNLRIAKLGTQVNQDMVRHGVNLTQSVLRDCGKTLRRARIAVFGSADSEGSEQEFVRMLISKGARINLYSPRGIKNEEPSPLAVPKRNVGETVENCDCLVFLAIEESFKRLNFKSLRSVMKLPASVVDLAGLFERETVENEGFLYRGLGRGIEPR